jgi:hypothetical protein
MHHDNTVVTIFAHADKSVAREYKHERYGFASSCEVILPFDTEWALNFKLTDGRRRRLELKIDGALVTDSLVVSGLCSLERFLDSDRRFKFVRADHEAVADPTSTHNGEVVVRLWREVPLPPPVEVACLRAVSFSAAGATVEGSKSDQEFGSTHWRGDEDNSPLVFRFKLLGREAMAGLPQAGLCRTCGGKVQAGDRFCRECGARLA